MPAQRLIDESLSLPDSARFKALATWARLIESAPNPEVIRHIGYDLGADRDRCVRYVVRRAEDRSMVIERFEEIVGDA